MQFTKYESAAEFSRDAMEVIRLHEIQNNLLIKNIGDEPGKTMLTVKDGGEVLLTAIRTEPHPMVMYETGNIRRDAVVEFFAGALAENGIDAGYFITEPALARSFIGCYGALTGRKFRLTEELTLYQTERVNDVPMPGGSLRAAAQTDMHFLPHWLADFPHVTGTGDYDLDEGVNWALRLLAAGTAYIWEDTVAVSLAVKAREVTGCAFLGPVYTPPQFRGKNYASACVSHLTCKLLSEGYDYCALYADRTYPPSNAVYQKLGYRGVFSYDQYRAE